eukprot:CFRG1687T1
MSQEICISHGNLQDTVCKVDSPTTTRRAKDPGLSLVCRAIPEKTDISMEGNASWYYAAIHIITASFGTGILALPYAFAQQNLIKAVPVLTGSLILCVLLVFNWYTSWCLSKLHVTKPSAEHPRGKRLKTYIEVGAHVWSQRTASYILTPLQLVNCISTAIANLVVAGQNIQSIYKLYGGSADTNLFYFTIGATLFEFALCLCPSLESFQYTSAVGAAMSVFYALITIALSFGLYGRTDTVAGSNDASFTSDTMWEFFLGVSTVTFLFGTQALQPDIQYTLKPSSPSPHISFMRGLGGSYAVVVPLYFLAAISGYLTFGELVAGDILLSISETATSTAVKALVTIAQVAVVIQVIIAFQVWCMPVYSFLENLRYFKDTHCQTVILSDKEDSKIVSICGQSEGSTNWEMQEAVKKAQRWRIWSRLGLSLSPGIVATRLLFVGLCGVVAMAIPFFGDIIALNGAAASTPLCFIVPIFFRLCGSDRSNITFGEKLWMSFVVVIMLFISLIGSVAAVRQIILDSNEYNLFK